MEPYLENVTTSIYGDMRLSDNTSDLISSALCTHGEWGYVETSLVGEFIKKGMVVYDLGAYIGTFSLGLAKYSPSKIVAVEPNKQSYKLLQVNLDNNCSVAHISINVAISRMPGFAFSVAESANNQGAISYQSCGPGEQVDQQCIEALTLQQLRRQYGDYDLVKLDIEGTEYEALCGDAVWIKKNKPIIWAECNESIASQKLLQFYLWAGLSPYYIAFPAFRRDNYKKATEDPYPIAYEAALVGGKHDVIAGFISNIETPNIICRKIESFEDLREALWVTPRWGRKDWLDLSCIELIALLGHAIKTDSYCDFIVNTVGSKK